MNEKDRKYPLTESEHVKLKIQLADEILAHYDAYLTVKTNPDDGRPMHALDRDNFAEHATDSIGDYRHVIDTMA